MLDPTEIVERLEACADRIVAAEGPSDVFRALLDGYEVAAPRAAVFLVRQGALHGWGSVGYGTEEADAIRRARLEVGHGWPGRLAAQDAPDRAFRELEDGADAFRAGTTERRESLGTALRVGGRTLAVLLAERDPGEQPWSPAAAGLLLNVARMRLEVDLARRRLQRSPAIATPPEEARGGTSGTVPPPDSGRRDEGTAAGATLAVAPTPVAGSGDAVPAAGPEIDAARRFARLIATDIRLYNEEDVVLGRRHGDLRRRMRDQLDRGRETFERRFPEIGTAGADILRDAYVQVLAGGDPALLDDDALGGPPDATT